MKLIYKYKTNDNIEHNTLTQAHRHLESVIASKYTNTFGALQGKKYTESLLFIKENIEDFNEIIRLFSELNCKPELEDYLLLNKG